jgi:hypothetical protein
MTMQQSSSSIGSLAAALARAQVEFVNPEKSMRATIRDGKGGAEQVFRYAPLSSGLDIVRKTLGKHEIAAVQATSIDQAAGIVNLTTTLAHSSGEWMSSDWPVCSIEEMASPKRMGAALTYARRYALFALVGIAGEDDLDAPDLNAPDPLERRVETPPLNERGRANSGRKWSALKVLRSGEIKEDVNSANPRLKKQLSVVLRDQLLKELKTINSAESAAIWARRILPAKSSLEAADARQLEEAFRARLAEFEDKVDETRAISSQTISTPDAPLPFGPQMSNSTRAAGAEKIDNVVFDPAPRRVRDKDHVRFVAKQACLICGRTPSDAHHLRFAQSRTLGSKASDEFTVPLCRGHHRELHRHGDEPAWWKKTGVDPMPKARALWLQSHPLPEPADVTPSAGAAASYAGPKSV